MQPGPAAPRPRRGESVPAHAAGPGDGDCRHRGQGGGRARAPLCRMGGPGNRLRQGRGQDRQEPDRQHPDLRGVLRPPDRRHPAGPGAQRRRNRPPGRRHRRPVQFDLAGRHRLFQGDAGADDAQCHRVQPAPGGASLHRRRGAFSRKDGPARRRACRRHPDSRRTDAQGDQRADAVRRDRPGDRDRRCGDGPGGLQFRQSGARRRAGQYAGLCRPVGRSRFGRRKDRHRQGVRFTARPVRRRRSCWPTGR